MLIPAALAFLPTPPQPTPFTLALYIYLPALSFVYQPCNCPLHTFLALVTTPAHPLQYCYYLPPPHPFPLTCLTCDTYLTLYCFTCLPYPYLPVCDIVFIVVGLGLLTVLCGIPTQYLCVCVCVGSTCIPTQALCVAVTVTIVWLYCCVFVCVITPYPTPPITHLQ